MITTLKRSRILIGVCVCGVMWGTKNKCHKEWKESWIVSTICIDYSALSNQINWEDSCFSWSRNHLTLSSYMNIFHSICSIWHGLPLSCFHLVRGWIMSVWTIRRFMHCVNIFSDGVAMNSISMNNTGTNNDATCEQCREYNSLHPHLQLLVRLYV